MGNNFIIDESFQLIRTNPRLTTNIQVVVDSNYTLYLESFNTNKELSDDKYKHFSITKQSFYEDKVSLFYDGMPTNLAFDIKYDNDASIMYNEYSHQFDDIYWSGARKVEQNQFYAEEFEYLAPLYIKNHKIPNSFIILRVDDPAIYREDEDDFRVYNTTKENFRDEIINKWKCVKVYDMGTTNTDLGYWINSNFIENDRFPQVPLEFDTRDYNFTRWYGIDYFTGVYTDKSLYVKDKLWYENPHFKLEEFVTDGYKNNELIFPNILNFKFLFDDTPASPFKLNKYSINRYFGFYVDLELIKHVTPYRQQTLKSGLKVEKNIFMSTDQITGSTAPFEWDNTKIYYIYAKDNLFRVVKNTENGVDYYKIISEYDININDINRDYEIDINFTYPSDEQSYLNNLEYKNLLVPRISTNFLIDPLYTDEGISELYADLYLINIDGNYHVLETGVNEMGFKEYFIRSDYAISCNDSILKYWIESETNAPTINVNTDNPDEIPMVFPIYRVRFYDIKDFDFNRVSTHYSDFDLDKDNQYVETTEQKLYAIEHRDASDDDVFKVYESGINLNKVMIIDSEYVATDELYEVKKEGLSEIWYKNQHIPKWGYVGSNSNADYPYKLNNNNKVGFLFNRTTDTYSTQPNILTKTHAYFYRIGNFYDYTNNYITYNHYKTQTLSIETESFADDSKLFNLDYYLKSNIDYFDYFFKNCRYINDDLDREQTSHYSVFNNGSVYNPSSTLFKGIKYNAYALKDIVRDRSGFITNYITDEAINFNNYRFSVIANFEYPSLNSTNISNTGVYSTLVDLSGNTGIHVFLNEKYKNILIIINIVIGHNDSPDVRFPVSTFHNTKIFDPIEIVYTGSNLSAETLTNYNSSYFLAYNFIQALNELNDKIVYDNYVKYYYIDSNAQSGSTTMNVGINGNLRYIESWGNDFPPFKIECETPDHMPVKRKSYKISALKGPKYNIYDKYKKDYNELVYDQSFIKEPLARIIEINEKEIKPVAVQHGEMQRYSKDIYRYNGAYEPIFKDVELFKNSVYYSIEGGLFSQIRCGGKYDEVWQTPLADPEEISIKPILIMEQVSLANSKIDQNQQLIDIANEKLNTLQSERENIRLTKIDQLNIDKIDSDVSKLNIQLAKYTNDLTTWTQKKEEWLSLKPLVPLDPNPFEPQPLVIDLADTTPSWVFKDKALGLCDNNYAYCDLTLLGPPTTYETKKSSYELTISDFDFEIPEDSVIKGITVDITKYATMGPHNHTDTGSGFYSWIGDEFIKLVTSDGTTSDNKARIINPWDDNTAKQNYSWTTESETVSYGGSFDMWGLTGITYSDLNSPLFGIKIQVQAYKNEKTPTLVNTAYIDCVCVTVNYTINDIMTGTTYYTYFPRNYVFDTDLCYFGEVEEIIFSKVNETENVLKIQSTEEDKSIYPMVDEFGLTYDKRFIFKSTWDSDYYTRTKNEIED